MENKNKMGASFNRGDQYDWQNAEKNDSQWQAGTGEDIDLRSAEAGGYGIDNHDSYYASREDNDAQDLDNDDDDDNDNDMDDTDTDEDNDSDDEAGSDWGNVDPQSGGFPTGNEPTAPGSAV